MSNYAIKNFIDNVEDSAVRLNVGGNLQARFGQQADRSPSTSASPTSGLLPTSAPRSGTGIASRRRSTSWSPARVGCVSDDEIRDIRQWDVVRVAPHVARAYESGPDGLEMIAVGNDRPEGGDGEMVQDFWKD